MCIFCDFVSGLVGNCLSALLVQICCSLFCFRLGVGFWNDVVMHFQHIITNLIDYWDRMASVGDRWSSVASELEETGQRLLNTHAHTHTHIHNLALCHAETNTHVHIIVWLWVEHWSCCIVSTTNGASLNPDKSNVIIIFTTSECTLFLMK